MLDNVKKTQMAEQPLDNCYFRLSNKSLRQATADLMRSDPSDFMANLFLYFYGTHWACVTETVDLTELGNLPTFSNSLMTLKL